MRLCVKPKESHIIKTQQTWECHKNLKAAQEIEDTHLSHEDYLKLNVRTINPHILTIMLMYAMSDSNLLIVNRCVHGGAHTHTHTHTHTHKELCYHQM